MNNLIEDCLFCKMIRGEVPCIKLYEDDHSFSIIDIAQVYKKDGEIIKGRSLVIPKKHIVHYYELDEEDAGHLFVAASKVARKIKKAFDPEFVTVFIRGQQVAHTHIILQPSTGEGDPIDSMFLNIRDFFKVAPEDDIKEIAQMIINA
ncbi:MAG: HIT family protein [Spirochaetota bacterium]|nr:HIT family protein [Spirochaetota bacterium]